MFQFGLCETHYAELLKIKRGVVETPKEAPAETPKGEVKAEAPKDAAPQEAKKE